MTVLRSREIPFSPSSKPSPKTLTTNPIHPSTPSQLQESPISLSHSTTDSVSALTRRRSSRLSSAMKSDNEGTDGFDNIDLGISKGKRKLMPELNSSSCDVKSEFLVKEYLSLRSGKRVSKIDKELCDVDEEGRNLIDCEKDAIDRDGNGNGNGNGKVEILELFPRIDEDDCANSKTRFSRREKGKWVVDDLTSGGNDEILSDHLVHDHTAIDESGHDNVEEFGERNLTAEALLSLSDFVISDALLSVPEVSGTAHLTDADPENDDSPVTESSSEEEGNGAVANADLRRQWSGWQKEQWLRTARHFARDEDVDNSLSVESEGERDIKDWPGPFSTAMKIIRDRTMKGPPVKKSFSQKNTNEPVLWIPRKINDHNCKKSLPPSLRNLCLGILAKNVDAIASLEFVPDAFRHRLSRLLCDSRKMNRRFLDLLFHGSPTEVCITDCSWLNEDEFLKSFNGCDPSKLMILQLDQCGRCIIDYVVQSSLAQSPNSLPALESLSLSGACRLSDAGIAALVSSAPALRSINLSQCSFLTSSSIDTLANSLGSTLRELYLCDCNLDPMEMVSALKKLEHLEVLSLAGIQRVRDNFIQEFITARGHHIKELILSDCIKLTDKSIQVISETCTILRAIDLVNVSKLSDYALCCLAIGCQGLQKLILSRNLFSDEAVAAFLEISGGNLKELSLNSVKKVDRSTAISLASFAKSLVSLDLSWCRKLTDEYLGLIVDNCSSLRVLKLSGCTQVTNIFLDGHSNSELEIIGLKLVPLLKNVDYSDIHPDSRMPSSY